MKTKINSVYLPVTRTVGLEELRRFSAAIGEVRGWIDKITTLADNSVAVSTAAAAARDVDSALNASMMGVAAVSNMIEQESVTALNKFEHAAQAFLGERRVIGEGQWEFFSRIVKLSEQQMQELQIRHGISLKA